MPDGTVLAFDFGLARTGAAVGNTLTRTARPLEIFPSRTNDEKWKAVTRLIHQWEPVALVVGVPLRTDGSEQEMTRRAQRFARQLGGRYGLPVFGVDERYSSVAFEEGRGRVDDQSAAALLEQWFEDPTPRIDKEVRS